MKLGLKTGAKVWFMQGVVDKALKTGCAQVVLKDDGHVKPLEFVAFLRKAGVAFRRDGNRFTVAKAHE